MIVDLFSTAKDQRSYSYNKFLVIFNIYGSQNYESESLGPWKELSRFAGPAIDDSTQLHFFMDVDRATLAHLPSVSLFPFRLTTHALSPPQSKPFPGQDV